MMKERRGGVVRKSMKKGGRSREVILITGGAGFIGSNLCRILLTEGYDVHAVDNLITGSLSNITELLGDTRFHFHEMDICDSEFLNAFRTVPIGKIFHLACPTGVRNIMPLGEEMILTCSIGTRHALEVARATGASLVYSSSAEVYGNPLMFPQEEGYSGNVHPTGARSAYEEGKRFGEALVKLYALKYSVSAKIVRIFNTFGPGMSLSDQRVIPQFLRALLSGEPLTIYGDGSQTRTYLYIDDLIRGLRLALERGQAGEVYNVGGMREMTVKELAEKVLSLSGHASSIAFVPHFIEDHSRRCPSTARIRALGWAPQVDLDEGLTRMMLHNKVRPGPSVVTRDS